MEAADIEDSLAAFASSDHDIDREFTSAMQQIVAESPSLTEFELLYHAINLDRDAACCGRSARREAPKSRQS